MEIKHMALIAEFKTPQGDKVAEFTVNPKDFKTGSRGYYANGKMEIDGKRYQVQIQLVEIGSKGAASEAPAK
jgi:hypothetical protein